MMSQCTMWKLTILIFNIYELVSVCIGESVIREQSCLDLNIPQFDSFDFSGFAGTWYELSRYPQMTQNGQCNRAEYGTTGRNGKITVVNRQVVNGTWTSISGTAIADNTGQITVTFIVDGQERVSTLQVLTFNEHYAVLFSCRDLETGGYQLRSWKMSRTPSLESQHENEMNEIIRKNVFLNLNQYEPTKQSCIYYPEFNQPSYHIVLNGYCSNNIKGVTNFNILDFSGTWFEIARYPHSTQNGECNRAVYEPLSNGTVSVLLSEVVEERLATISGHVTTYTSDGQLFVSLDYPTETIVSIYTVLAVDYDKYALLYSCLNLENGYRKVSSWVLSRDIIMSPEAHVEVNKAIDSSEDLQQGLYIITSQSPESCFYYPDFDQPEYIELSGACDNNIRGVTNFNTAAYLGTWLELARYPQPTQIGQCNRAVYGALPGGISVLNSEIVDKRWQSISGQAVVASHDGTGRLQVTLNVNNEDRESDYYVLATDYSEYALVYTCTTLQNGNRRVGSWLLSKTGTLNEQAKTTIDEVVNWTPGLHQKYYQPTSQDSADCFYYPEFEPSDDIELPGPCDTSITGVANFKMAAYAGPWLEVARYPQPTQTGQCNRAEYALMTTLAGMSVINSQVVDKRLLTISGQAILTNTKNTGELRLTFEGYNENWLSTNYYVLATNYFSYALVYSCTNVDNGNRQRVSSWKLSRTGTLTPQDNAAINEVISKTQGLSNEYYQITDQSDEACFYYPDIAPNDDIIIPGQCDETVSGFASFDMEQFQGTWYQIRRYDPVTTSCIGARLTQDSDNINLISYEVVDGQFSIMHRAGKINSTDNTGQFSLVMPDVGSEETTDTIIYILTTDYTSYAFAYSCENEGNFRRRIRAWQLSRERTMSPAGEIVIAQLIEQRQELHEPYFKTVEQNDICPEPSAAFLIQRTTIVILVCIVINFAI